MIRTFLLTTLGATVALAGAASAQTPDRVGEFERPFGLGYGAVESPIETSTRDANGNRVIVNGRFANEGSLSGGLMDQAFGADAGLYAVGNQLNVITQGNWNTVIIDSTQINNGDVTAVIQGAQ